MLKKSSNKSFSFTQQDKSLTKDSHSSNELEQIKRTIKILKRIIYGFISIILIAAIGWFAVYSYRHILVSKPAVQDPVPLSIRQGVGFSIYYPNSNKLPSGYVLDTVSFSSNGVAVLYDVDYGKDKKLHFSVQQKPSNAAIQDFYAKHIPLHTSITTSVGIAAVGAIGSQTVISLPTNGNAWVIITGPMSLDHEQLSQVLNSIQSAK